MVKEITLAKKQLKNFWLQKKAWHINPIMLLKE
jgi:hypothetical protein